MPAEGILFPSTDLWMPSLEQHHYLSTEANLEQGGNTCMMHYKDCVAFIAKIILDNQSIKLIFCHFFNVHLFFRVNKTNPWIHPAVSERGTNMYLARASVSSHTAV